MYKTTSTLCRYGLFIGLMIIKANNNGSKAELLTAEFGVYICGSL
jgi:hypothetical protein